MKLNVRPNSIIAHVDAKALEIFALHLSHDPALNEFRAQFDEETLAWLYGTFCDKERSEVSPRTQMKSLALAKSFRPAISRTWTLRKGLENDQTR